MKNSSVKRQRTFAKIGTNVVQALVFLFFFLLTLAAFAMPYFFDNAETIAAKTTDLAPGILPPINDNEQETVDDVPKSTLEIENLKERNSVQYVNHTPNQFLDQKGRGYPSGTIERLDQLTPAKFGTLQFVVMNLDPQICFSKGEYQKAVENLSYFKGGIPNLFYLTFYLPACFDAASVFVEQEYFVTLGDMEDYDPSEYIDVYPVLERSNVKELAPYYIDFNMSYDRNLLDPIRFESARVITIHYRSENGLDFSGNMPLIGTSDALKSVVQSRTNYHIVGIAVTLSLALSFTFLILLKRNKKLIGPLGILIGAILLFVAGFVPIFGPAGAGASLSLFASAILLLFALLSSKPFGKIPLRLWYVLFGIGAVHAVVCLILPFTFAWPSLSLYAKIASCVLTAAVALTGIFKWRRENNGIGFSSVFLACLSGLLVVFLPFSPLTSLHPATAVAGVSALVTIWFIFSNIFRTEHRNISLTNNLKAEIAAQTETLQNTLTDREKILSFLSHDMKKTALSIDSLVGELKQTALDEHGAAAAEKIDTRNKTLLSAFSEILRFTKRDFSNEPFSSVDLPDLLEKLENRVKEDCEANGIELVIRTKRLTVRAKSAALFSVLFNLVFNAIEHADCTKITIGAKKSSDRVVLRVADNGKGLPETTRIFDPYVSGEETESNSGLGLFLVKSETEAMGGKIAYDRAAGGGSVFTLTLLSEIAP